MNILVPIEITDAILTSSSLAEDSTSAWVAGTYAVGDFRHVVATHRVYKCAVAGSSTISPELDPTRWNDDRPTNKWAPFDSYVTTPAQGVTSISYTLLPGFANALSLYGLVGGSLSVIVKDGPGGNILLSKTIELYEQALGLYELLFTNLQQLDRVVLKDLPMSPNAEITITINAASGADVAIGMINVGDLTPVIGAAAWGGTEYGATAEPKTYSYIKFNSDGTSSIKRRGSATDIKASVAMPEESAEYAVSVVQKVLDKPVSSIATTEDGYSYLNVFGLVSASLTVNRGEAKLNYSVNGFI